MIKKLRLKFVIINMSIVIIMLCIILGLVFHFTRANLETESLNMMQSVANRPFQLGMPDTLDRDVRLPYFTIQIGIHGEMIATTGGYYDLSNDEFLYDLIRLALESPKAFGVIDEYNLRYYRVETLLSRCLVFADMSSELATLNNLMKSCLFIGTLGFLLFLGVSVMLSHWAVRPVEQAWKQQRQFIADVSHELKTPLTVIMTNAELMQAQECEEQDKGRFSANVLTVSRQMRVLIEQMLELARSDNSDFKESFEIVSFSEIISDAVLPFEPLFFEKNLNLKAQIEDNIYVFGAAAQLSRAIEAFIDNAQKYSQKNATTWVTLKKGKKGYCVLEVANEGEEIPPEKIKHIFKRFYRIDQARSRTGSFGLGLSIAESVAARHKGKVRAESENGVNRFFMELPCV